MSVVSMRPAALELRPARRADLAALVALLGQLFRIESDFSPVAARQRRGLTRLLGDRRARVLVAARGGRVVGMVTAQLVVSTAEGAPSAWVEDLVVDDAERGRGVGARLLDGIARWAGSRGATRLQLLADRENAGALRFYAREGWAETRLVCWRRTGRARGLSGSRRSSRRTPSAGRSPRGAAR
jgi:GNAT superfamily N-acetyltransferase